MRRRTAGLAVVLATGVLALAAYGSGAERYGPTGIDELVIPMSAPRAADFVDRIDNPWLPLTPGRVWTYDVRRTGHPAAVQTVRVLPDPVQVDGIATTAVATSTVRSGAPPVTWTDYYAQDTRGNVWWLGSGDVWRAGREGAQAGLAMAAEPRLGDGYRAAYEKGVVEDVVTVAGLTHDQPTPTLTLERASALSPGDQQWDTYRKGIGMVDRIDTGTGEHEVLRPSPRQGWSMGRHCCAA